MESQKVQKVSHWLSTNSRAEQKKENTNSEHHWFSLYLEKKLQSTPSTWNPENQPQLP